MVLVGLSGVRARRMIYYEEHKHISVIQAAVLYPGGCVVIILGVLLLSLHGRGRTLPDADDKKPSIEHDKGDGGDDGNPSLTADTAAASPALAAPTPSSPRNRLPPLPYPEDESTTDKAAAPGEKEKEESPAITPVVDTPEEAAAKAAARRAAMAASPRQPPHSP